MKKIILLLFLVACQLNVCYASPTGFMGIPWGSNFEEADATMLNHAKQIMNKEEKGNALNVSYTGGDFNGLEAGFVVSFYNGRLFTGKVYVPGFYILDTPPQTIFADWNKLVAALKEKYGKPTEYAYYIPPYASDSPILALGAVLNGDGKATARWIFKENNDIAFEICCRITEKQIIEVVYSEKRTADLVKTTEANTIKNSNIL